MSTQPQNKNIIKISLTFANQYHYGARDSGSSIIDNGIQRRKKFTGDRFEEEMAIFGLSLKGLLRELAYEICQVGVFPFKSGKEQFTPIDPNDADSTHPFYSLFGYADCHGKIRVSHGTLLDNSKNLNQILEQRTSIRMDPTLHSTKEGALFTFETCNIQKVEYTIELVNPTEEEATLLLAVLNRLEGKTVAGRGSTGGGLIVKAEFDKSQLAQHEQKLKDLVQTLKKGGK